MTSQNDDPILIFYFHVFLRCHHCTHLQGVPWDRSTTCAVCGKDSPPNAFQVIPVDPQGMPFKLVQIEKWKPNARDMLIHMSPKLERWELDTNLYVIRWANSPIHLPYRIASTVSTTYRRSELYGG